MKLPKTLLGAMLVGMAVQTTGCKKDNEPAPKGEKVSKLVVGSPAPPANCPGCGMG